MRTIRSYMKRAGRSSPRKDSAYQALWPKYGLANESKLDIQKAPVVVEIGFGMGRSLLEMAKSRPDHLFVGFEVHRPGIAAVLAGMQELAVENIRIFEGDVCEILPHAIPDNSIAEIYILFPDPWPKKRHHKRRLIQTDFIALLQKKLKENGILHLATDWQNYAEHMMEVLSEYSGFKNVAGPGNYYINAGQRPVTKFEQQGLKKGYLIRDLRFTKE
jgi:tRNA (guanine-N7-)-methyltransferase